MDLSLRHSDKKRKAMPCRHRSGVKTGARPTEAGAGRARVAPKAHLRCDGAVGRVPVAGATGEMHDPCSESSNAIALVNTCLDRAGGRAPNQSVET